MQQGQKRRFVFLIVIGAITAWVLNLLVDNPWTHRLIRTVINEQVEKNTNLSLDFKAIKASVVPPGIALYGVRITTNAGHPSPDSLVVASQVKTRVSIWSILTGSPRLGLVELRDLDVIWPPPGDFPGFLKNPAPPPEKREPVAWPPPFPVPVDELVISNGRVLFEHEFQGSAVPASPDILAVSASGINLEVGIDGWDDIEVSLDADGINATRGPGWLLEEAKIETSLSLRGSKVTATRLKIAGERLKVDGSALTKINADAKGILQSLDLTLDAGVEGDLSVLGSILDIPETQGRTKGKVRLDAFAPVEANLPANFGVAVEGSVEDARLGGIRLHNSKAKLKIDSEKILFEDIDIIVGETHHGKGKGTLKLNESVDFDFQASTENLRLMDLLSTFDVGFDVLDFGLTTPNLRVRGKGDPFVLNVDGTTALRDFILPATPLDHSRFPVSPTCLLSLNLAVTERGLDTAGTAGSCFRERSSHSSIRPGDTSPPPGSGGHSSLRASGMVWFDEAKGMNLLLETPRLDASLGDYFAQQPLSGLGSATTRIHGPYTDIKIDVSTRLDDTAVANMALGQVSAEVTVSGKTIAWHKVEAITPDGGKIRSPEGRLITGDVILLKGKADVENISSVWTTGTMASFAKDVPLSFAIPRLTLDIEGPLLHPLAWTGKIEAELGAGVWDGESLFDKITLSSKSTAQGWNIDPITTTLGDFTIATSINHKRSRPFAPTDGESNIWSLLGWHPDDELIIQAQTPQSVRRRNPGSGRGTDQPVTDHLQRFPWAGKVLSEAGIRGLLVLQAKMRGTLKGLQGTIEGSIDEPTLLGSPLAPLKFRAIQHGLKSDVVLSHSGNALEGRFSANFGTPDLPYEWYFSMKRLDVRAVATSFFYNDPRNYAYLTADWTMKGRLTDWWRSTGDLKISDVRARFVRDVAGQVKTLQIQSDQPARLIFANDGWSLEGGKELFLNGKMLNLKVSVPTSRPPENLNFKLEGIMDMALLREFATQVESASGKLRINGSITGSVSKPDMSFEITDLKANPFIASSWEPVSLGLADLRPPLRNIRVKAAVRNDGLVIESFAANKGIGTVSASGKLNFNKTAEEESRLDVSLRDASVIYPVAFLKSFDSTVNGAISISGRGMPWRVSGDLKISKARSTREVDIRDELINVVRRQQIVTSSVSDKPIVEFDLNIDADQTINITNRNIQAVLSSSIQLTGNDIQPLVSGQVEVVRGKFVYKRDFTVTRGLVIFDDPVRPDPSLDILAVSEVQNYRVYISISGKMSQPVIDFSVDPPTRQNGTPINKVDILVLLSRGSLPDESRAIGETQNAAAAEAFNLVVGQFEEPVEKLLDLSGQKVVRQVYIDTYPSTEGNPIPRFNMPLNLSDELDVVLRVDQSSLQVSSEYALNEGISLSVGFERKSEEPNSATRAPQNAVPADTGADLRFRFAFP
jgi:hypothetical protein